ncbi:MAG: hypothetical protein IJZ94_04255 [Clostridia bacterium]|nr:hypothetical protein [Clostridia bacterium]
MSNSYIKTKKSGSKAVIIILSSVLAVVLIVAIVLAVILINKSDDKDKGSDNSLSNSSIDSSGDGNVDPNSSSGDSSNDGSTQESPAETDENTIATRFSVPEGYIRVDVEAGSFAEYIRNYTLKPKGSIAYYYDDETGSYFENKEASTVGVFELPNQLNRWMQCADSVIMLYAEYLYSQQKYSEISFTFANGFECDWLTYSQGNRFNSSNSTWELKADPDDSYESFQKYLDLVYQYANTDSLARDMSSSPAMQDISIGDAFVVGVSQLQAVAAAVAPGIDIKYGHAIFVADVAVNPTTGECIFMLAEGNTPATDITIIENPDTSMGVWFKFNEVGSFVKNENPGIPWSAAWLKRFPGQ